MTHRISHQSSYAYDEVTVDGCVSVVTRAAFFRGGDRLSGLSLTVPRSKPPDSDSDSDPEPWAEVGGGWGRRQYRKLPIPPSRADQKACTSETDQVSCSEAHEPIG